jgi:Holliday junction resolvase RusA-like endonuclease
MAVKSHLANVYSLMQLHTFLDQTEEREVTDVQVKLKLPPSQNHMYKNVKRGNRLMRVLTEEAEAWVYYAVPVIRRAMAKHKHKTLNEKTVVYSWFFYKDNIKKDNSNFYKLLLDTFEKVGVYTNDYYALPRSMDFTVDKNLDNNYILCSIVPHSKAGAV